MVNIGTNSRTCAFVDLYQEMRCKTWIWWMDVCKDPKWMEWTKGLVMEHRDIEWMEYKDLEWTWKMEEFWSGKKWKEYQHLETLFLQQDTYHFQHKMQVQVDGVHEWYDNVKDEDHEGDYKGQQGLEMEWESERHMKGHFDLDLKEDHVAE